MGKISSSSCHLTYYLLYYSYITEKSIGTGIDKCRYICYNLVMDIKKVREQLGLTAEELAQKLGVSVTTVSRWETGRHKPSKLAKRRLKEVIDKERI